MVLRAGNRKIALAVDETLCIRNLPAEALPEASALTEEALSGAISAIGTLDHELLAVLESARLVSEELWSAIEEGHS